MNSPAYRQLLRGLLLLLLASGSPAARAQMLPDAPPLSADPQALLHAAEAYPPDARAGATTLWCSLKFRFDPGGRLTSSTHALVRVDSDEALRGLAHLRALWQPWHQKQPVLRARVITRDGLVHPLDASLLRDSPVSQQGPDLFDDIRVFGGPLPAVAVGALIETEEVTEDTQPLFAAGIVHTVYAAGRGGVRQLRVEIDVPRALPFRYELDGLPQARVQRTENAGRVLVRIENAEIKGVSSLPAFLPSDVAPVPEIRFSTAASWQAVASAYAAMVEPQVRPAEVAELAANALRGQADRPAQIAALVRALHERVRYTGVEFGVSSYVPQATSVVLERHYGDCKDKAALLVAMLRAARIPAFLALLTPGLGEDVHPTLPGFGEFTHAIVYVPGKPDLWIDATAEYARPGELSGMDQGRWALVIRDTATGLVRTPSATAEQNLVRTRREVTLPEYGAGRVAETVEVRGASEEWYRAWYERADDKVIRQELAQRVKREFGADSFSDFSHAGARDFSAPFTARWTVEKAPYVSADLQSAVLWIQPPPLRQLLPQEIFSEISDNDKSQPPRAADFVLPSAFTREWDYRILPPPGFQLRALPDPRERTLGPARLLQQYSRAPDGATLASVRFVLPDRRLTAEQARALVSAIEELEEQKATGVFFDKTAHVLLKEGKYKDALAEYHRLVQLHPKEALHHADLAAALVEAGLGDAARREAELATTLEPASSIAWELRGAVLQTDLIGRRYHQGFDRAGAIEAYEKALALNPKDAYTRFNLAVLREYGDDGVRYSPRVDLDLALAQYRELRALPNRAENADQAMLECLLHAGRYEETLRTAPAMSASNALLAPRIAATALVHGAASAIDLARREVADEKQRSGVLLKAAGILVGIRRYPEAVAVETAGSQLTDNPSLYTQQLEALRKTRIYTDVLVPAGDPRSAVQRLFLHLYGHGTPEGVAGLLSHMLLDGEDLEKVESGLARRLGRVSLPRGTEVETNEMLLDWLLSNQKYLAEGKDSYGYRIRLDRGYTAGSETAFVVSEGGKWKLLALSHMVGPLGLAALAALERNDLEAARQWIDWARDEMETRSDGDPLSGPVFPRLWTKGQQADRARLQAIAAVVVSGSRWSERVIPILQSALAQAATPEDAAPFRSALCAALAAAHQWQQLAAAAEPLVRQFPASATAFRYLATACIHLQRWPDLDRLAHDRLSRLPEDLITVRELVAAAIARGDMAAAASRLEPLIKDQRAGANDLNLYAWTSLFVDKPLPGALSAAQRANSLTNSKNYAILHTLACVYAEEGQDREARQALLQAMTAAHLEQPDDAIWYGFGRLAELYGEREAALAAFARLKAPQSQELAADSTFVLAQRHGRKLQQTAVAAAP